MTTAEVHLNQYGVSMEVAKNFIMSNLTNLSLIFDTCKAYGVNNDMIADIVGGGFKGSDVEGYFNAHGFTGAELGHTFAFTNEWLSGRTTYSVYGNDTGPRTLNSIGTTTYNANGTAHMTEGNLSADGTWSLNGDTLIMTEGGGTWYVRASGDTYKGLSNAYITYNTDTLSQFTTNGWYTPEVVTTDLATAQSLLGVSLLESNVFHS